MKSTANVFEMLDLKKLALVAVLGATALGVAACDDAGQNGAPPPDAPADEGAPPEPPAD